MLRHPHISQVNSCGNSKATDRILGRELEERILRMYDNEPTVGLKYFVFIAVGASQAGFM